MVAILWAVFIVSLAIDIALTNQDKKRHNVSKGTNLINTKSRPKDFIIDIIDIGLGIGLVVLSDMWIAQVIAWVVLIISILALLTDIHRLTDPNKKS